MIQLVLLFFAILGVPLFVMFAAATLAVKSGDDFSQLMGIFLDFHKITRHDVLVAIPLFTLVGYLLSHSKSPERIVRFVRAWLGWMHGGLAIVAILCCAFITVFTGASGVTIIALGGLMVALLTQDGYKERFSIGLITCCGSLGLLFYPALPLILMSMIASNTSKDVLLNNLALAGIFPGILLIVILSVYSYYHARQHSIAKQKFNVKELKDATWGALGELMIPLIIFVGIYGSWIVFGKSLFAPTEVAGIVAFYVLILEVVIYREVHYWRDLPKIIIEAMTLVGGILIILGITQAMTNHFTINEVPQKIFSFIQHYISSKWAFLVLMNVFLLIVGCLMDIFSAIVVVVPILMPIALKFGVNPIHFAIIFLANLEIGYLTPPVGLNLFISSFRFNKPVIELYRIAIPYLVLLIVALIIITYVPVLSLGLL